MRSHLSEALQGGMGHVDNGEREGVRDAQQRSAGTGITLLVTRKLKQISGPRSFNSSLQVNPHMVNLSFRMLPLLFNFPLPLSGG